ncbi:acyltransferase family protein [Novosphingobium rosa]|uniref:acyltransferase family protein n=1 Tax=Novosphingobium rosa TaxID=76978 RepID=UPI00083472C0|nr:acyltransferase family protein [Novosphingobium rosa]
MAHPATTPPPITPSAITPRMSLWLDAIRAAAALAVMAGHGVQQGLYSGPWPFSIALQQNAMVVFFVLSGLMIAGSTDSKPASAADYALARMLRILPVALPALALSLLAAAWAQSRGVNLGDPDTSATMPLWPDTLRAMLFLSDSWHLGLWYNPPWWSLCYEVWFYALFGALTFLKGARRIATVAVMALVAGPNILLMLPVWWTGVWIARNPALWRMTRAQAWLRLWLSIAMLGVQPQIAVPMQKVFVLAAPWALGHALYAPSYLVLALALALGLTGLSHLADSALPDITRLAGPVRRAAGMSFSLYVLHWPLIGVLKILHIAAGANIFAYAALLAIIVAASTLFAMATEAQRPALRARIAAFRARRPTMAAAAS